VDPPRTSATGTATLLERETELERLRGLVEEAAAGRGGAAFIAGPAGIGKTSLLRAAIERAGDAGLRVLTASGGELEQEYAYGLARDLLARPAKELTPLEGAAAPAARVLGVTPVAPSVAADPFAAVHALYWLTVGLAEREPVLLAVDDAHWGDDASLRFLAYLVRRIADLPVLVLVAARPGSLLERVIAARIEPAPLSVSAVVELRGLDADAAAAIHAATRGNPLLCTAPPGEVIRRIGPLPDLARAVAVLGAEADLHTAAELAGVDVEAAGEVAARLTADGLLEGAARVRFVHPLLRAAVLETIPAPALALLHGRAARLLDDPEQVAAHLLAALPGTDPRAGAILREAARAADARGDPATAVRLLRRALQEPGRETSLLHQLGVAELRAGEPEPAVDHLRDAGPEAERDLALALRIARRYGESVATTEQVLRRTADPDAALALEGELHQTAMITPATYAAVAPRFADLDRPVDARTRGGRALLAALATEACLRTDDAARVRALAAHAFEHGLVEDDDAHSGLWANIAFPLIFAEGFQLARAICDAALDRTRRQGSPMGIARAHLVAGMLNLRTGAVREAAADARTALDVGRDAGLHPWLIAVDVLLEALVELGELDEGERVLQETGTAGALEDQFLPTWALYGRAVLHRAQGEHETAKRDFVEVGRRGREGWRPWNPAMFAYRGPLGEAAEEVRLARRWGAPRALGIALRAHGELQESAAVLARAGAPLEHARTLVELGAAIARGGRRVAAREPLREALELAHRCGATALAARAREELVAAGARPRRELRTGVEALTPSELRVTRLAADGLTNRQIAEALFVTMRTVEVHLTHAYAKLGVSSRAELKGTVPFR
jgi:DNA-binding CsgD family transcriptional regulator